MLYILATSQAQKHVNLDYRLRKKLDEVLKQEETYWFQKSKTYWIQSRDLNAQYYYASTVAHQKQKNRMMALKDPSGNQIEDPKSFKDNVFKYFKSLFTEDIKVNNALAYTQYFPNLTEALKTYVNALHTREEIKTAIDGMAPHKAAGPGGLNAAFFQNTWEITGDNICKYVNNYFQTVTMPEGSSSFHEENKKGSKGFMALKLT